MVHETPLDRPALERLSNAELLKLADLSGIDVPPVLDRTIVIEELLDAAGESPPANSYSYNTEAPKRPRPPAGQTITAPLPKQYNITYIEVLIRDPLWAFAFWEINAHDRETHEGAPDFDGYCLRAKAKARDHLSFTVPVEPGDSAWYLGFPPEGGRYTVELCAIRKDTPLVLAVSKPFRLPTLPEGPASGNPLLRLSGIEEFTILRNTERSSRLPKHYRG